MKILSTYHNWADMPFWSAQVDSIELRRVGGPGVSGRIRYFFGEVLNGWKLWRASRAYEGVVTDARLHVALFGLLQRLPWTKPPRHLMLECLWERADSPLRRWLKSLQVRCALGPSTRAGVYARREVESFSSYFRVDPGFFVFIPYHTTTHWYEAGVAVDEDRPYLFAGGESQRDYPTLFDAVAGLDVRVVVAVRNRAAFGGREAPANVEVITTDHQGFLDRMHSAAVNVVPLQPSSLRSAGHQTFLNAMAFGTATVVTDVEGAGDYVQNWVDGVLVPAGDASALRAAIQRLAESEDLRHEMGQRAALVGQQHSTRNILNLYTAFLASSQFFDRSILELAGAPGDSSDRLSGVSTATGTTVEERSRIEATFHNLLT
jgi:hypothetical protein